MPDDVPEEVKRRRNNELLAVQNAISLEDNQPLVGSEVEVLVEGPSKSAQKRAAATDEVVQLVGRTVRDQIVVFDGPRTLVGQILPVDREGGRVYVVRTVWSKLVAKHGSVIDVHDAWLTPTA